MRRSSSSPCARRAAPIARDPIADDADVGAEPRRAGAVDDAAVGDQDVEGDRSPAPRCCRLPPARRGRAGLAGGERARRRTHTTIDESVHATESYVESLTDVELGLSVADGRVRDHRPRPLRDARRARSNRHRQRRRPLRDAAAVAGARSASSASAGCCWSASIISTRRAARRPLQAAAARRARAAAVLADRAAACRILPVLPDRWPVLQALAGPARRDRVAGRRGAAGVDVVAVAPDRPRARSSDGA